MNEIRIWKRQYLFQVKADTNSEAMGRLKTAKSAIKNATDSLVKAAQDSIRQEEEAPVAIKADIFKEVIRNKKKMCRDCTFNAED